jgi:hypothetical protein
VHLNFALLPLLTLGALLIVYTHCTPTKKANDLMSYSTIARCANDTAFQSRVTACAAQEGATSNPNSAMNQLIWTVSSASDIEAAYASALSSQPPNPNPGGDEAVITDQMILSSVQANWSLVTPFP